MLGLTRDIVRQVSSRPSTLWNVVEVFLGTVA
jgi:hypothetical protein